MGVKLVMISLAKDGGVPGRVLGCPLTHQLFVLHRRHFHENVDADQERSAGTFLIARHRRGGAGALLTRMGVETAGAGIHRRHQHKAGGIGDGSAGAADGDDLVFQGLAKALQGSVTKLRELVQEQHTPMAQGYFAGAQGPAAAEQAPDGFNVEDVDRLTKDCRESVPKRLDRKKD